MNASVVLLLVLFLVAIAPVAGLILGRSLPESDDFVACVRTREGGPGFHQVTPFVEQVATKVGGFGLVTDRVG